MVFRHGSIAIKAGALTPTSLKHFAKCTELNSLLLPHITLMVMLSVSISIVCYLVC